MLEPFQRASSLEWQFAGLPHSEHLPCAHVRQIRKRQHLYEPYDEFRHVYWVLEGSLKTVRSTRSGIEQVMDFHLPGEIVGLEGISGASYGCAAVALEDSSVRVVPYKAAVRERNQDRDFGELVQRALATQLCRNTRMMQVLAESSVEQRLAFFLLDMAARTADADVLALPMTRAEIGNFLGMSSESVSRALWVLSRQGTIRVSYRAVELLDIRSLGRTLPQFERRSNFL